MKPAIFIDRDGTLADEVGYINHISRFRLYPYAAEAVKRINRSGALAVIVTNQAGVARGYFSETLVDEVHGWMQATLEAGGARLDGIYACLHHPAAGEAPYRASCDCRKPKPGLLHRAAAQLDIDLARSFMIGDRYTDVQTGWNAGGRGVLVKTGYGLGEHTYHSARWEKQPDIVADHLLEAVDAILESIPR